MQKTRWIVCTLTLAALLFTAAAGARTAAGKVLVSGVESCFLGVQDNSLVWSEMTDTYDASLWTRLKSGGNITSLARLMGTPVSLTVYEGNIYWIEAASALRLNRTSLDGMTTTTLSNGFSGSLQDLKYQNAVTHDGFVYWASTPNTIEKISTVGGGSAALCSTQAPIRSLARDNENLYWIEQTDTGWDYGAIRTMPLSGGATATVFAPTESDQIHIYGVLAAYQGQVVWADIDLAQSTYRLVKSSASGGTPAVLAVLPSGQVYTNPGPTNQPSRIVIDSGNVYWIDDHSVNTMPLDGGTPQVLADNLYYPLDLAITGGYLYWSEKSDRLTGPGSIKKMPATGGAVAQLIGGVDSVRRLAAWGSDLYWAEDYSVSSCNRTDGQIAKLPQGGGPATAVVGGISVQAHTRNITFVTDSTAVYFPDGCAIKKVPLFGGAVERIAYFSFPEILSIDADDEFVYSGDLYGVIRKTAKDGSGTSTLSAECGRPSPVDFPVRVKRDMVFWGCRGPQSHNIINRIPKTGGAATALANIGTVTDLAADSDYLYILDAPNRTVTRVPIEGGTPTVLKQGIEPMSTYLALGPEHVYWISPWGIVGVPKAGGNYSFNFDFYGGWGLAAEGGNLYWTNLETGTINTRYVEPEPALISSVSPAEGITAGPDSLVSGRQPAFSWTASGSITGFTMLFSVSPTDFHSTIASASVSQKATDWTPPASMWRNILKSSDNNGAVRNIYWKVLAKQKKKGAPPAETEVRSFKAGPAQTVTINSPASGAIMPAGTTPVFDFATASNIKFRLEISSLSDFSQSAKVKVFNYSTQHPDADIRLQESLPMASWKAIKKLIGTGSGYFRIKAWDGINRETVSEVRFFTIQ